MLILACIFVTKLLIAGTGKTVITCVKVPTRISWCNGYLRNRRSVVVDYMFSNYASEDTKVVYIYCDYKDQAAQTASNLIACLARQMIGHPAALPQQLVALHRDLISQKKRPSLDELKTLLIGLCNQSARTYIIVDALDECEANHERRLLLRMLEVLPPKLVRLFVTSRPNSEDISRHLSKASQIIITAPESDLREYIIEKMEERRDRADRITLDMKETIILTVSTRASGMYDVP